MGETADLGVISLPAGITNNKTGVGDNFLVDRKTYQMLPATDAFVFEGKSIRHDLCTPAVVRSHVLAQVRVPNSKQPMIDETLVRCNYDSFSSV
jgi:hypothetical protein